MAAVVPGESSSSSAQALVPSALELSRRVNSLVDLTDIHKILQDCISTEASIDAELEALLAQRHTTSAALEALAPSRDALIIIRGDAERVLKQVSAAATFAQNAGASIRTLDVTQDRVRKALAVATDELDRATCADALADALAAGDLATAARHVARFRELFGTAMSAEGTNAMHADDRTSLKLQADKVASLAETLAGHVRDGFDKACAAKDAAAAVRFAKLFSPLGLRAEGVQRFYRFVVDVASVGSIALDADVGTGDGDVFAALTALFKDVAVAYETHHAACLSCFGGGDGDEDTLPPRPSPVSLGSALADPSLTTTAPDLGLWAALQTHVVDRYAGKWLAQVSERRKWEAWSSQCTDALEAAKSSFFGRKGATGSMLSTLGDMASQVGAAGAAVTGGDASAASGGPDPREVEAVAEEVLHALVRCEEFVRYMSGHLDAGIEMDAAALMAAESADGSTGGQDGVGGTSASTGDSDAADAAATAATTAAATRVAQRQRMGKDLSLRCMGFDFHVRLRQAAQHYAQLECYVLESNVAYATSIDELPPPGAGLTHSCVDDGFFVAQKSAQRALSSCAAQVCAEVMMSVRSSLGEILIDHVRSTGSGSASKCLAARKILLKYGCQAPVKAGAGAGGFGVEPEPTEKPKSLAALGESMSAAVVDGVTGAIPPEVEYADAERRFAEACASLNDADVAADYVTKLKASLEEMTAAAFANDPSDRERVRSCLDDLEEVSQAFRGLLADYVAEFSRGIWSTSGTLAAVVTERVSHASYVLDEEAYRYNETVSDPWASALCDALEEVFLHSPLGIGGDGGSPLTPSVHTALVLSTVETACGRLESILLQKRFNQLGGLQLDREIRKLSSRLASSLSSTPAGIREKLSRLSQMATLVSLESEDEVLEVWDAKVSWRLSASEVRKVLSLRDEFTRERINALGL
ncbi:hypothetical protein PPROV_000765200 [Pycnococcus provasolii]|uniref:Conserved oligomeric Golgi complex subunit 4 n=1 Tax=Pycnococcus provasolii TaxID=41880 RepID=A0A830HQD6_9CHLO|nr:hypothetical protein PPROV_000765200 [Pycnococcus provasolii]